jgi:hypothetical protein
MSGEAFVWMTCFKDKIACAESTSGDFKFDEGSFDDRDQGNDPGQGVDQSNNYGRHGWSSQLRPCHLFIKISYLKRNPNIYLVFNKKYSNPNISGSSIVNPNFTYWQSIWKFCQSLFRVFAKRYLPFNIK